MAPTEPAPIREFRGLMHDIIDFFVTPYTFEDFDALAACHSGLDREHLGTLVHAAERVFLDMVHHHVPSIPGSDHRRSPASPEDTAMPMPSLPSRPRSYRDRYTCGDIVLDADGLPWRYEPRWPGDDNPWAFCG